MVPAVGIEPTRPQGTRDFECEKGNFSNPLMLVWFSNNYSKILPLFDSFLFHFILSTPVFFSRF
jgi:hypothetical protein